MGVTRRPVEMLRRLIGGGAGVHRIRLRLAASVFLANLIFADRFRDETQPTVAFGANLLGAGVGGVLEYTALISGYRSLLFVVAGAYALALVASRRSALSATGGAENVCPPEAA